VVAAGGRPGPRRGEGRGPAALVTGPASAAADVRVSVVVPVYNEHATIAEVLDRIRSVPLNLELIVVDDGSTDGTRQVLETERPRIDRLILQERNRGKGAAVKAGFAASTGDVIVIQDADLEYDPHDFRDLLHPIVFAKADLVLGSRMNGAKPQRAYYYWHYVGNRLITFMARVLYNTTLSDIYTCYKMFRREQLRDLEVASDGFEFDAEFLAKLLKRNLIVFEVPIAYYGRSYEEGKKIRWYHTFKVIWNLIKYRVVS
jgi:glycosyltransferase involved in cell wall biosynthesis